jgi:hypothetical protein
MESMSWSDDTRCLYCEGRLPLYRKITHGQFCSSAHRKAYWQDQERLAIERLHQSHSSLRSYRSLEVQPEVPQEAAPYPDLERVTQVRVVAHPELETEDLELDPVPSFDVSLYPIPDMSEPPMAASDLLALLGPELTALRGSSPELVAADPFEYEITLQPLPPSHASGLGTSLLPEGLPVAVWSYLGPRPSNIKNTAGAVGVAQDCDVEICHPQSLQPATGIRAAGRVGLPLTAAEAGRTARMESSLRIVEMDPAPVTSVELEVPIQSDVLLQLLDQQVPHPDQMHELAPFAAHPLEWVLAGPAPSLLHPTGHAALPSTGTPAGAAAADYQLVSSTEMLQLSSPVLPTQSAVVSPTVVAEIAANSGTGISTVAMPAPQESAYRMDLAGLQSLASTLLEPVQGVVALQTGDSRAFTLSTGASSDVRRPSLAPGAPQASAYQMDLAGLQSLRSNSLRPVQGMFVIRTSTALAFDLLIGVSSDVTYPSLTPVIADAEAPMFTRFLPLTFDKKRGSAGDVPRVEPIARLLPQVPETHPILPSLGLEPLDRKPPQDALRDTQAGTGSMIRGEGFRKLEPAWAHATGFWQHAPRDLKLLLFAIPALLALVFHPGLPRVAFAAPQTSGSFTGSFKHVLNTEWGNVHQTLESRAAVALDEDFRSGLDSWASPGGSTTEWSFDPTGFVRPGPLALYRPSVNLTDYQMQFVGLIDKKALSWVVRAADFENFYVVKLQVLKAGPMPTIGLTRYAVIDGKAGDRHDVDIPLSARADTIYNVRMDVHGSEFSVEVQGQIADSWTEARLPRGGIGFFTASGEASRLRWVQVTHQYDMLGRLCAYLAPYDTTNGSWQP